MVAEKQLICKMQKPKSLRTTTQETDITSTAEWKENACGQNTQRAGLPWKTAAADDRQILQAVKKNPKTNVSDASTSLEKAGVIM